LIVLEKELNGLNELQTLDQRKMLLEGVVSDKPFSTLCSIPPYPLADLRTPSLLTIHTTKPTKPTKQLQSAIVRSQHNLGNISNTRTTALLRRHSNVSFIAKRKIR
jgi:hypothetical protein